MAIFLVFSTMLYGVSPENLATSAQFLAGRLSWSLIVIVASLPRNPQRAEWKIPAKRPVANSIGRALDFWSLAVFVLAPH